MRFPRIVLNLHMFYEIRVDFCLLPHSGFNLLYLGDGAVKRQGLLRRLVYYLYWYLPDSSRLGSVGSIILSHFRMITKGKSLISTKVSYQLRNLR
jgi:hypothetical protein